MRCYLLLAWIAWLLVSCVGSYNFAPVVDANHEVLKAPASYRVKEDDTLYSIAWRYGVDYQWLAQLNHMTAPYTLVKGQLLAFQAAKKTHTRSSPVLSAPSKKITIKKAPPKIQSKPRVKTPSMPVSCWLRPAAGKVVGRYTNLNPGMNIVGKVGAPVVATAAGLVVYAGQGISGYGKLIIIKHGRRYLSAYAHNDILLVGVGDTVKRGQKIATMGHSGSRQVMLHFEIRKNGRPVDPRVLLKTKGCR